jgi:hypothetical protein
LNNRPLSPQIKLAGKLIWKATVKELITSLGIDGTVEKK